MANVTITYFKPKRNYKFLWLKLVRDYDLNNHCTKCLIGKFDRRIWGGHLIIPNRTLELGESRLYYLCGVCDDWVWAHNLHVAFAPAFGQEINIDDEFCALKIENARRIKITNEYIDWHLPQAKDPKFNTCRNWWFANMMAAGAISGYKAAPHYRSLNLFGNDEF